MKLPFNPIEKAETVEKIVMYGNKRKYYHFRFIFKVYTNIHLKRFLTYICFSSEMISRLTYDEILQKFIQNSTLG
jgi:nucleoside permease NupC